MKLLLAGLGVHWEKPKCGPCLSEASGDYVFSLKKRRMRHGLTQASVQQWPGLPH